MMDGTCFRLTRWIIFVHWTAATVTTAAPATNTCHLSDPENEVNVTCIDDLNFVTSKGVDCSAHSGVNCKMLPFFGFSRDEVDVIISSCPCSCQLVSDRCWSPTPTPSPPPTLPSTAEPIEKVRNSSEGLGLDQQSEHMSIGGEGNHTSSSDRSFGLSTGGMAGVIVGAVAFCFACAYLLKNRRRPPASPPDRKPASTQKIELEEDANEDEWDSCCSDGTRISSTVDNDIEEGEAVGQSEFEASTAKVDNRMTIFQSKQMKPIPQKKNVVLVGGIPGSVKERDTCKDCSRKKKCKQHQEKRQSKKELNDSTSRRSRGSISWFIPTH
mmetsp:Transcript_2733/g.8035  ORF Transcript_2733/g.8035 Transcript_2733/m.8035 type:complete len:326 (-) Transcript_2733:46-1023(-)